MGFRVKIPPTPLSGLFRDQRRSATMSILRSYNFSEPVSVWCTSHLERSLQPAKTVNCLFSD